MQNTETTNSSSKSSIIQKVIIGVLILLSIVALYFAFSNYSKLKENQQFFETEKSVRIAELKSLQKEYDDLQLNDSIHQDEILEINERLKIVLDSVEDLKANTELVNDLQRVKRNLLAKLKRLKLENKELKEKNALLAIQKDSISSELSSALVVYDSVNEIKKNLELVVAKAQKLFVSGVNFKAVRIKSNNKVVPVTKAKKASGIEVCFDVQANTVAESGEKSFYIQVVSPSKKVLGGRFYMNEEDDRSINFSKVSKFRYKGKAMTVCDFVEPLDNEAFESGKYTVNIFDGVNLISSSAISLK
ncbi:hypothetical protein [Aquimarina agarivorans]|uniref:hypothetical protein n=1 Tax=Aquimarina agarivorans TaxID=980584 RepID=UPI000248FAD2|nr:hypothetical protein [Aquimarina agarivorans]